MACTRIMVGEDLDQVITIEATAFGAWWKQLRGESADLDPRTRTNVLSCREKDPTGALVAEEDAHLVGFVFSRTWGSVGWFGTFSVLPEYQGRGIGKQLIAASLEYLRQEPQRVIGLETMPESPYNLGLYLRLGFQCRHLTLSLAKVPAGPAEEAGLARWSQADPATQERWLADLRQASSGIYPGLDYSKEVLMTARHGQGETLVLAEGRRAVGASVVWLTSARVNWGREASTVQTLFLHPGCTSADTFHALVAASEALACAHGKEKLVATVNARHPWALEQLLHWGYRVERTMVRMVLPERDWDPPTDAWVNLGRWAG